MVKNWAFQRMQRKERPIAIEKDEAWFPRVGDMEVGQLMIVKELQSFAQSHEDIPSDLVLLFFPTLSEFLFTLTIFHSD